MDLKCMSCDTKFRVIRLKTVAGMENYPLQAGQDVVFCPFCGCKDEDQEGGFADPVEEKYPTHPDPH